MPWALEASLRPHSHRWPQLPGRGRGCSYSPSWHHHLILTSEIECKWGSRLGKNPGTPLGLGSNAPGMSGKGNTVTCCVPLSCDSSLGHFSSSSLFGGPKLSLTYTPPPPGSHPCPPPRQELGPPLAPSPSLPRHRTWHNQLPLAVCLLSPHSPHISQPSTPQAGRRARDVFHSVWGQLAQGSVIWYISKCLILVVRHGLVAKSCSTPEPHRL